MKRRVVVILLIALAVVFAVFIYFSYDPSKSSFFPKCFFKSLTGLNCPGCGTQRAVHALLHGDFVAAVGYNAAAIVSIPLIAVYGFFEIFREKYNAIYARICSVRAILIIFVSILLWWILRNIFGV